MMRQDAELKKYDAEVASGERFEFGKNWVSFLKTIDEERIAEAKQSLMAMLGAADLEGKRFLDAGCGSGLFSLAARVLGASVHSFDYDPNSVRCAQELKRRYFPKDPKWTIAEASVLNDTYLSSLGLFDVVYSWGVLHHTGNMWKALDSVGKVLAPGGALFIAIYNDQGTRSIRWRKIKQIYNHLPSYLRFIVTVPCATLMLWRPLAKDTLRGHPTQYLRDYKKRRGMSVWHDIRDWLGGLPFEVAKPEQIFDFYKARGFMLDRLLTDHGSGCNQFVFIAQRQS